VLLLHGWAAFKELWWSTLVALAPRYRAFALDLPGHGESPLRERFTMPNVADSVSQFCDEHGLREIALVGHSMGGNVALELALRRPDLVRCLALVAPAADAHALPPYVGLYVHPIHGWTILRVARLIQGMMRPVGDRVPHIHGNGLVRPFLRRVAYASRHDPMAMRALLSSMFANPLSERAKGLRVPTLVINGQFDSVVPPAEAQRIADAIPNARFRLVRGAMHNPMDERPAAFERVLTQFLADQMRNAT
jgi:pimeloyl-ACP methyl ester carboxylesterase